MTNTKLETIAINLAVQEGIKLTDARKAVRLALATMGAAISGTEAANAYCEEMDLPIRFRD